MAKFGIGIPTFNRWDLLESSLEKYILDFPNIDIHILDNGQQSIPDYHYPKVNVIIHRMDNNIGVAGAWNYLIDKILISNDNALILNDDIYLGKNKNEIKGFINENHFSLVVTSIDWCVFIINRKTWEKVGKFDEAYYPAYCEDCDYHLRMIKMGVPLTKSSYLIPQKYQASMTMNKNPELFYKSNHKNRKYFKSKWGCYPEDILPD